MLGRKPDGDREDDLVLEVDAIRLVEAFGVLSVNNLNLDDRLG
jgi:hypothetical protein